MSDDRDDVDSRFNPVKAGELTDASGLYGEFRAFRAEVRTALELMTLQLLPLIKRANEKIDDLEERVAALEAGPKRKR